jgi:quercetin dioxygenase-like cupin family protein
MHRESSFAALPAEEPYDGLIRRSFDCASATVTEYTFDPGARFPLHYHPQEQITLIQEGDVELTVDGETATLHAGDWSVVGPQVEHSICAGDGGARIVAIVIPRREHADAYTVTR